MIYKQKKYTLSALLKFALIVLFFTVGLASFYWDTKSLDFFMLFLFVSILIVDLYLYPKIIYLNLLVYLTIFLNIVGVFVIEYAPSYYLYEIEQWSHYSGSIPLLLLVQFAFIQGINTIIREKKISAHLFARHIDYKYVFLVLFFAVLVLTYALIFIYKPAPMLNVDRFEYDKIVLGHFGKLTNILFYFSLGLGILYFKERRVIYLFFLVLIEVAFLLKGHKFWNLMQIAFLFFLPYVFFIKKRKMLKTVMVFVLVFILMAVAAIRINLHYYPSFKAEEYIHQRIAQEGQLWWSTFTNYHDTLRLEEALRELQTYFALNDENIFDIGMYKVMQLNTTQERFEWKISKLSRYTYSTPALIYYYFGSIGSILILFFFGMMWGLWLKVALYIIKKGNLIASVLASRLFFILRKAVKDGDIYKVFTIETALIILLIAIILYFSHINYNLKKSRSPSV